MVRALLTAGEREAIKDSDDMDQNTKSSHISRIKNKIELLSEDTADLKEHRPDLYEQLQQAICEDSIENRISELEGEVHTLDKRLNRVEAATEMRDSDTT